MSNDPGAFSPSEVRPPFPIFEAPSKQEIPITYQNELPDSGYATGIALVLTSDSQFQMRLEVSGDVEVVRDFENAKFLQLSFQPLSKNEFEEILSTLSPKLDDTIVPDMQQRFEELATFAKQASPEQLVRLEKIWTAITGGNEHHFLQGLREGDSDNLFESLVHLKHRIIRIVPENFEGLGRLQFVLDPPLTIANPTDTYLPNVSGKVKASVTSTSRTDRPFLTLFGKKGNDDNAVLDQAPRGGVVDDYTENNLSLRVSGTVPLTYDLTADITGLWKQLS